MTERQEQLVKSVEREKETILKAERWLWAHPQTGFREWEAHGYLAGKFKELGYELTEAGNIPGFYADADTGRPGPKVCIIGELDGLVVRNHPEAVDGVVHACGHHAQGAALLGAAAALKQPGVLETLSGSVRLMAVPAEESIEMPFRETLRREGVIRFTDGKSEFMHRGFFDGVDIAMLVHAETDVDTADFSCVCGRNGFISKEAVYQGAAAHAGSNPHKGINAQYAAMLGLQACNDLRETFRDAEVVRFHPVLRGSQGAVNVIPDEVRIEAMVRGRTLDTVRRENRKINRALAAGALAMGAKLEIHDRPGCAPEYHDGQLMALVEEVCASLVGPGRVDFSYEQWFTSSTDFGHLTRIMPGIQFHSCGAAGTEHGVDYWVPEPERLCVNSAKAQVLAVDALLRDGAARGRRIIAEYQPEFSTAREYLMALEAFHQDRDAVIYHEDGTVTVDCQ